METLILYSSKYGCTRDCALNLKDKIKHETTIVDLKATNNIKLENYSLIIIGSPIYMGRIRKEVKNFYQKNMDTLLNKNLILYICCSTPDKVEEFFKFNYPNELYSHSLKNINFGAQINKDKLNFTDKKITDMVSAKEEKSIEILDSNIDTLANYINELS